MRIRTGVLALGMFALLPSPAAAQGTAFVGALGGATFHTVSSGAVAGRGGVHIGNGLFVIGEVGRVMDVTPQDIADEIDELVALAEVIFGLPVTLEAKVPATYAFGGVRWVGGGAGRIRPFVEGGAGIAHLKADVSASIGGQPVPQSLVEEFADLDLTSNEFLLTVGGGVNVELTSRLSVDGGYRYVRVFTDDPAVNTNLVYAGIVLSFGR